MDCEHSGGSPVLFETKDYISGENFTIRRCGRCGLVYTDRTALACSATREIYYPPAYYGTGSRYRFLAGALLNRFVRRRARLIGEPAGRHCGAVLDVGCGQGYFLKSFAERGWQAIGIEVSNQAAHHARNELGLDVRVGQQVLANLQEGTFDVICIWHVLEHIEAPEELLCVVARILKSDGRLLLAVPNFGSLEAYWTRGSWFHLDAPRHVTHFNDKSLTRLVENCGLQIVRKSCFTPEYDFFCFAQSIQNWLGFDKNLVFRMLRSEPLRGEGAKRSGVISAIFAILTFPVFLLLSLVYVPVAIARGQGSSINLVLKKKPC